MKPGNAAGTDAVQEQTPQEVRTACRTGNLPGRILLNPRSILFIQCALSATTIAVCQRLRLNSPEGTEYLTAIAALLLFAFELAATRMLEAAPDTWLTRRLPRAGRVLVALGLFGRICLWACAVVALIEWPANLVTDAPYVFLRPALSRSFWFGEISVVLMPKLAIVTFAIWALLVEIVVIRRRVLRGLVVIIGAPLLLAAISLARYHVIFPTVPVSELADGNRVQVVFDPTDAPTHPSSNFWNYPRALRIDEATGNIYGSFGSTFGSLASSDDIKNLWQFNRATGEYHSLPSNQTRVLAVDPTKPVVWAAPWHKFSLLKIDKDSFTVQRTIDMHPYVKGDVFEPLAAAVLPPFLYIGLTTPPALVKVDTRSGEVVGSLDLAGPGGIPNVDVIVDIQAVPREDSLFLTVEGPSNGYVVRVDPVRMEVLGHSDAIMRTPWSIAATSTGPSELFVTTEHGFTTYRVDPETLKARPLFDSMPFARIIFDPWIDRLIITDVRAGTISLVTREGSIGRSFRAGTKPMGLAVSQDGIYVLSASGLLMFRHESLGLPLCMFPSPNPEVSCTPAPRNP